SCLFAESRLVVLQSPRPVEYNLDIVIFPVVPHRTEFATMTIDKFERELRSHMHRSPFRPFLVVLNDGRTIFVDEPAIAFGGGRAAFIGPENAVDLFDCEDVKEFRLAQEEPAA